jgi:hypothetical protein
MAEFREKTSSPSRLQTYNKPVNSRRSVAGISPKNFRPEAIGPCGKYSKSVIRSAKAKAIEREHILGALRETGWVVSGPKGAAVRLAVACLTTQK